MDQNYKFKHRDRVNSNHKQEAESLERKKLNAVNPKEVGKSAVAKDGNVKVKDVKKSAEVRRSAEVSEVENSVNETANLEAIIDEVEKANARILKQPNQRKQRSKVAYTIQELQERDMLRNKVKNDTIK